MANSEWTTSEFLAALAKAGFPRSKQVIHKWRRLGRGPSGRIIQIGGVKIMMWDKAECQAKIRAIRGREKKAQNLAK